MLYENLSCPRYVSNRQIPSVPNTIGAENAFVFPFVKNFYGLNFNDGNGVHQTITNDYISRAFSIKPGRYFVVVKGDDRLTSDNCSFKVFNKERVGEQVSTGNLSFKYSDNDYCYYCLDIAGSDSWYYLKISISASISDFKIYGVS